MADTIFKRKGVESMSLEAKIIGVHAREILDSRGNPTIEVAVTAETETTGKKVTAHESVPAGASTGRFEAIELRDGEPRYFGLGVQKVVDHVNTKIKDALLGENVLCQSKIDRIMVELDGTDNKGNLGANAILGVSLACAKTAAKVLDMPLYRYLGGTSAHLMPVPMMNVINGGAHAKNSLDFQEFMIMPIGANTFKDGLRMGAEVYHFLKHILKAEGRNIAVGDEGGFAPDFRDAREVFQYLEKAVVKAGYEVGKDMVFAMDAAASELYSQENKCYEFVGEAEALEVDEKGEHPNCICRTAEEMISLYEELCNRYPICSIEDCLHEEDWEGWKDITKRLGNKVQLVGDDLFVTNCKRLKKGIEEKCANAILIKPNQIGTLTETMEAVILAKENGFKTIMSHRSGETEDTTIADLAVGLNCGQIKTGAPCRTDRVAKYNRLLRIEEELRDEAVYGLDA